jgi:hypothetical protein
MPLTLELCTFDPGIAVSSPAAYAAAVVEVVETAWDEGADMRFAAGIHLAGHRTAGGAEHAAPRGGGVLGRD